MHSPFLVYHNVPNANPVSTHCCRRYHRRDQLSPKTKLPYKDSVLQPLAFVESVATWPIRNKNRGGSARDTFETRKVSLPSLLSPAKMKVLPIISLLFLSRGSFGLDDGLVTEAAFNNRFPTYLYFFQTGHYSPDGLEQLEHLFRWERRGKDEGDRRRGHRPATWHIRV